MAYRNKYEADARGWRAAFATFWFDGGLLDTVISSLSSGSVSGGTGSGDPHYMFNSLRADHKVIRIVPIVVKMNRSIFGNLPQRLELIHIILCMVLKMKTLIIFLCSPDAICIRGLLGDCPQ